VLFTGTIKRFSYVSCNEQVSYNSYLDDCDKRKGPVADATPTGSDLLKALTVEVSFISRIASAKIEQVVQLIL